MYSRPRPRRYTGTVFRVAVYLLVPCHFWRGVHRGISSLFPRDGARGCRKWVNSAAKVEHDHIRSYPQHTISSSSSSTASAATGPATGPATGQCGDSFHGVNAAAEEQVGLPQSSQDAVNCLPKGHIYHPLCQFNHIRRVLRCQRRSGNPLSHRVRTQRPRNRTVLHSLWTRVVYCIHLQRQAPGSQLPTCCATPGLPHRQKPLHRYHQLPHRQGSP